MTTTQINTATRPQDLPAEIVQRLDGDIVADWVGSNEEAEPLARVSYPAYIDQNIDAIVEDWTSRDFFDSGVVSWLQSYLFERDTLLDLGAEMKER